MLDVYLAVGHGVTATGVYDPGAIGADGREEHLEAFQVCTFALAAMRRSGLDVVCETADGAAHDPDFIGSTIRANQLNPRVAIEVHFDFSAGLDGFSGLYCSSAGHSLAEHIGTAFVARQLPRKNDVLRPGLHFLRDTNMPALIPEVRRVLDYPASENKAQGEAIAEGTCAFLGHAYQPPLSSPGQNGNGGHQGSVTQNSALLAAAHAQAGRAERYLLGRPHGNYGDGDVRAIVKHYYQVAGGVGLDPLLAVAQMTEETGHLTSYWSQRPHRNLAGIGVTGAPGVGLSFPDLVTAVRAHVGRLLAYALPAGAGNHAQLTLISEALSYRPLPDQDRGIAPTLQGLTGTWAADAHYAEKVAALANAIRGHS